MGDNQNQVNQKLDHLFRREAGKIIAILTKVFGPSHIDMAEVVVQEALLKAAQVWPFSGIPNNPAGWILQVARNKALDIIRRDRIYTCNPEALEGLPDGNGHDHAKAAVFEAEISDDQLRLMFVCCHPILSHEARVALTLKTICGFSTGEISRAFLVSEETIAQRLVRAKQKIKDAKLAFEMPDTSDLVVRLDAVLDTIYLLFNEGYSAHSGDLLVKEDMCLEACRLAMLLTKHAEVSSPKVYALLALMLLQASRLKARTDSAGEVLLLADQDRGAWDHRMIEEGLTYLNNAADGTELSHFHLLAGIAACHATAKDFASTDWQRILDYYDIMTIDDGSPILILNRAVALSFVKGPKAALQVLNGLGKWPVLQGYYLYSATMADFYRRMENAKKAVEYYNKALTLAGTEPEKRFLQRRLQECGKNLKGTKNE